MARLFTARIPAGAQIAGLMIVFAAFVWVISVASVLVCFVFTVALAVAWCLWLEQQSNT